MTTYSEMVRKLAKNGKDILADMTPEKLHVWHMASCLMGEAGELAQGASTQDGFNMIEELGDLEFYAEGLRDGLAIDYDDIGRLSIRTSLVTHLPAVTGVFVSACDVFDACKKWIIYEKDIDKDKLMFALSSFENYMAKFRFESGITRQLTLDANMAKLAKRYGEDYTYTNAAAQNRADKT